jgi:hypothetical protein
LGASSRRTLHMRWGCQGSPLSNVGRQSGQEAVLPHRRMFPRRRALPRQSGSRCLTVLRPSRSSFSVLLIKAYGCWPCGVVGDALRRPSAAANPQGFAGRVHLVRICGSSPSIDRGFDARRASHPVAVLRAAGTTIPHSRGHRAREGGSTLYGGISQPLFATVRPPDPTGLIRPRGTHDNDPASRVAQSGFTTAPAGISPWLIYLEGDEQFPGERDNRDAADPAALEANALAEPTAESTVGLVSHPHPGELDHCGAQKWISWFRDALLLIDAATLP